MTRTVAERTLSAAPAGWHFNPPRLSPSGHRQEPSGRFVLRRVTVVTPAGQGRAASLDADERTSLRSQRPYLDITIRTRRSGTRAHSPSGVHSGRSHNSIGGCTDRSTGSYPSISRTVDGHYCHRPAEEEMVVTICNEISSPRMPAGFAFSPYSERMTSSGVTNRGLNGRHHHV